VDETSKYRPVTIEAGLMRVVGRGWRGSVSSWLTEWMEEVVLEKTNRKRVGYYVGRCG